MKLQTKSALILLLTLALLTLSATAQAAGKPHLQLSVKPSDLKVGEETAVDVLVKNAPTIYGADVRLVFDPTMLQVVDADKKLAGVQLEPGDFLDPAKSFALQHQVNNETGTIDYALTLLNPAPAVQGDGLLVRITFRAKAAGQTTLSIKEGLFGTRTGETIAPALDSAEIRVAVEGGKVNPDPKGAVDPVTSVEPFDGTGDKTLVALNSSWPLGAVLDAGPAMILKVTTSFSLRSP
jgi:hypothetical protein